jgi:hypothetical protein
VIASLGSHDHNCNVGDSVDRTHCVGNDWRAPTRTQHNLACSTSSTVAGTEHTAGGTADVNLASSTRIGWKACTDSTLGAIHKLRAERSISSVEVVAQDDAVGGDR